MLIRALLIAAAVAVAAPSDAAPRQLDGKLYHLRIDGPREWAEFPDSADAEQLEVVFDAEPNAEARTLRLRQQDVKQLWTVELNGREIGRLHRDENDMVVYFVVPPGTLVDGENTVRVAPDRRGRTVRDDVRVGEVALDDRPLEEVLAESTLEITVTDGDDERPIPARITILNEDGALQSVDADPDDPLAVRPGTVYTANGEARFGLPPGNYTIHAGRGFEYSLATVPVEIDGGETFRETLTIRREVPTDGYVACDPHIHTLTHSGHGDATVQERMATIAGEGIELAVATDHNAHIDHRPYAEQAGVRKYFTPVVGNEVTTPVGHFNIFPVPPDADAPNPRLEDWASIFEEIERTTGAPVVILNHARDKHSGVRPFEPSRFNAVVAENLHDWPLEFNGMEGINSGATQTDVMQLLNDWMALLNRGLPVAPVGSSDSHDVARHFVGQGRTYIRADDSDPGAIDVDEAVESFRRGRVMVSYGLLAEIEVDGHRSGELAPAADDRVRIDVRVLGPHWTDAERVELFANGEKVHEVRIGDEEADDLPAGVKWEGQWRLDHPGHDVHLVVVARGPGIDGLYWKTAKPYQPTSSRWEPEVIGCSGALWIDGDGDGRQTSAREYAERLHKESEGNLENLLERLADYDAAVASHAAHLYRSGGGSLTDSDARSAVSEAPPAARAGFERYIEAWRETVIARADSSGS